MIRVKNVGYKAGKKMLLDNISFEVRQGELLAIIGANGAGKSTLMKLLSGDQPAHTGEIWFNESKIQSLTTASLATQRAVLSQQNTLSVSFSVEELVLMGRYPHFQVKPGDQDLDIVAAVMQETGVSHLATRDYTSLSGGEQQRVQLARVLAQIYDIQGAYLFLDEPTNGLDLLYQEQILSVARRMADKGYGVVAILHDINFASRYSDRVLILKTGKMLAIGPAKDVINVQNIKEAFQIQMQLLSPEGCKSPFVVPEGIFLI
jgi:iron complex transport system ATP-binding protein